MKDGSPFARLTDYEFRHWVAIQLDNGAAALVHRLFALRDADGPQAWFAARERRNELPGYLQDLALARAHAQRVGDPALLLRYAVAQATLTAVANNLRPALIARLMATGFWSRPHALAWARLSSEPQQTLQSVTQALLLADRSSRGELAALALDTASSIGDPDNRVLAVAKLAPELPNALHSQALAIVAACDNEGSRKGGLVALSKSLSLPLKLHALALLDDFRQQDIALPARFQLAEGLPEPERRAAHLKALEQFRKLARTGALRSDSSLLRQTLELVPLELLDDFVQAVDNIDAEGIHAAALRRLRQDPSGAGELALKLPSWQLDTLWSEAAQAHVARGELDAALQSAAQISPRGRERLSIIEALLPRLPAHRQGELVDLSRDIEPAARIEWLRAAASAGAPLPHEALRSIGRQASDANDRLLAECALASTLDDVALHDLVSRVLAMDSCHSYARRRMLTDLAPLLSREEIEAALLLPDMREAFSDAVLGSLAQRLSTLGEHRRAIDLVVQADLVESVRSELLATLSQRVPQEYLEAIRAAIAPSIDALAVVRARAALGSAPHSELAALALQARYPEDQLQGLVEIAALPGDDEAARIAPLLQALAGAIDSRRCDGAVLSGAMQALAKLGADEFTLDQLLEVFRQTSVREEWCAKLMTVFAGALAREGRQAAAEAAMAIAIQNAIASPVRGFTALTRELTPSHAALLESWVRVRLGEGAAGMEPLVWVVCQAADSLPRATIKLVAGALATYPDLEQRFLGLRALLPLLPRRDASRIARRQFRESASWSYQPLARLFAISTLAPHAPDAAVPFAGELDGILLKLPAYASLPWLPSIFDALPAERTRLPELLEELALDKSHAEQRLMVLTLIAPMLNSGEARRMLEVEPGCASLYARMAACGDIYRATEALHAVDNMSLRSDLVSAAARELPSEALEPFARAVDGFFRSEDALSLRAAKLGEVELALELIQGLRSSSEWLPAVLAVGCACPAQALPKLFSLLEKHPRDGGAWSDDQPIIRSHLLTRQPTAEQHGLLVKGLSKGGDLRALSASRRADVMPALAQKIARLPRQLVLDAWDAALRQDGTDREALFADLRAFGPALRRCLPAPVVSALDAAIADSNRARWLA